MGAAPRIVAFAGSLRKESFNKKLARIAAQGATNAGADVTFLDLKEYPLPIFDEDLEKESGIPAKAMDLKKIFIASDGLLISAPEYNSSITAVLKNTIDWLSRPVPGEESLAAFKGKAAVLMSASPGALGGLRGLVTVRSILGNIGVVVLPEQIAVPKAHEAFNADGTLKDGKMQESIAKLGERLTMVARKLKSN
ncbi:MAG TPA: NAD(P)H-dependent oxidoreductase [Planctomycetota bacterium]|nr:NAD(P)H-dependent oxidoreductase [Planctomycetota bacterium]